jgi:hypothetical protein
MLDDYPMLRMAMTTTEEADVYRVLLPALRRLITMSSLDGTAEPTAERSRGRRYRYRGQALLSARFPDTPAPTVTSDRSQERKEPLVAEATGLLAAESGTLSVEDMALLLAGIMAIELDVAELMARNERALSRLSAGSLANLRSGGDVPGLGCRNRWSLVYASRHAGAASGVVSASETRDDDCFKDRIEAGLALLGARALIKEVGSTASGYFARAVATGATRLAAAAAGGYVLAAAAAAGTAYVVYAAITCSEGDAATFGPVETPAAQAPMLWFTLATDTQPRMART